jgi:hypothetical protein
VSAYLARYPNLADALGPNYRAALQHWFAFGKGEGRKRQALKHLTCVRRNPLVSPAGVVVRQA